MENFWLLILTGASLVALSLVLKILRWRLLYEIANGIRIARDKWQATSDRYKPLRILNAIFYLIGLGVTIAGLGLGILSLFDTPDISNPVLISPPSFTYDSTLDADKLLELVNVKRTQQGLPELTSDPVLTKVAEKRVVDMVENRYYAHRSPNGLFYYDLLAAESFSSLYSCENLNVDFTVNENRYVESWLESNKGHRECLLDKRVTRAGYAVGVFNDPISSASGTKTYIIAGIHAQVPEAEDNEPAAE